MSSQSQQTARALLPAFPGLQYLLEREREIWKSHGVRLDEIPRHILQEGDIGSLLLSHGKTVKDVHFYFRKLDFFHHFSGKLGQRKSINDIRVVHSDGRDCGIEEGAGPITVATHPIRPTTSLTQKEFQLFRQSVLCAFFPVLSTPSLPSPISPIPFQQAFQSLLVRSSSANQMARASSSSDSDQATGLVQSEALCAKVREIFGLSRDKFEYYTRKVADELGRKTAAKLLAEELSSQLYLLENNMHPYYSPKAFVSRNAYDTWHHWERSQLTDLINKFWHFSLPPPPLHMVHTEFLQYHHQNYCFLLVRIMRSESNHIKHFEQSTEILLSSSSLRLLKEFGLRHGVGELFRRIVYLEYIANHFLSSVKYVQHTTLTVKKMTEVLPVDQGHKIMVKQEVDILQSTLSLLQGQCSNLLTQMQTLFPNNKPTDGIESLIELLSSVLELKSLLNNRKKVGSVGYWLKQYMQENFQKTYNNYLMILRTQMEANNSTLTPSLLSSLVISLMDEVSCFEQYFNPLFSNYFHLSSLATKSFYGFLMEDIQILCQQQDQNTNRPVDRTMLRLALRLNQLDQKWHNYIKIRDQKWRLLFFAKAKLWIEVIKAELVNLLRISIGKDRYSTLTLPEKTQFEDSSKKSKKPQKVSILTPSNNSAFNSLVSSLSSSPLHTDEVHMLLAGNTKGPIKSDSSAFPKISHIGYGLKQGLLKSLELEYRRCETGQTGTHRRRSDSSLYEGCQPPPLVGTPSSRQKDMVVLSGQITLADHSTNVHGPQANNVHHGQAVPNPNQPGVEPQTKNSTTNGDGTGLLFTGEQKNAGLNGFSSDSEVCVSKRRRSHSGSMKDNKHYPFFINDNVFSVEITNNLKQSINVENGRAESPAGDQQQKATKLVDGLVSVSATDSESDTSRSSGWDRANRQSNSSRLSSQSSVSMFLSNNIFSPSNETNGPSCHVGGTGTLAPRVYPVSSSLVDVVTMLNRLVEFGHDLCQVLCWQGSDHSSSPASTDTEESHHIHINQMKISLYQLILQVVSHILCLYADSMIFIDMCATPATKAAQMLGEQLVSRVMGEASSKLVWMCRHMLAKQTCNMFVSKKANLLCDRFEPVTHEMCIRINNISSLLTVLPVIHGKLLKTLKLDQIDYDNSYCLDENLNDYFVVNDLVPSLSEVMTPLDANDDGMLNHNYTSYVSVADAIRGQCADHLQNVLKGMLHLIAYKTSLFFGEGLELLMQVNLHSQVAVKRFRPLTDFLANHIAAFQEWLYPNTSLQLVQTLWSHVVQSIKCEANNLWRFRANSNYSASLLLQAVGLFIECIHNKENSRLDLDKLVKPTEDLLYLLQLYTLSSSKLILLYHQMESRATEAREQADSHHHLQLPPQHVLSAMFHDLHSIRKCFSGQQLVNWILSNYLFSEEISTSHDCLVDRAVWIGQKMVDTGVICQLVDGLSNLNDSLSSLSARSVYPKLTLCSHLNPSAWHQQQATTCSTPSTLSQLSSDNDDGDDDDDDDDASKRDCPLEEDCSCLGDIPGPPDGETKSDSLHSRDSVGEDDLPMPNPAGPSYGGEGVRRNSLHSRDSVPDGREGARSNSLHSRDSVSEDDLPVPIPAGPPDGNGGSRSHSQLCGTTSTDLRRLAIQRQMNHVGDSPSMGSSIASEDSFQEHQSFFNSQAHFYYFFDLDTPVSPSHSTSNSMDQGRSKPSVSQHPIGLNSEHLLTILYSRKKKDRTAAQFIQHVSDDVLQRIEGNGSRTSLLFGCF